MRKAIIIIIGLVLIGFIGTCIYFVAGVSATIPPIKKYQYSGSVNQLLSGIKEYSATNPNVSLKITDTAGNKEIGYAIYMDVEVKGLTGDILYNLKCEKSDNDVEPAQTLIQLIGVFNTKNYKIGGYGIKGIGVKSMVKDFDTGFLVDLQKQQNMSIKSYN
jgi:hypothetical protein